MTDFGTVSSKDVSQNVMGEKKMGQEVAGAGVITDRGRNTMVAREDDGK